MKIQEILRWYQRNAAKQNFARQMRRARYFFAREKKVAIVGFYLTFPRNSKNRSNSSLALQAYFLVNKL